MLRVARKPLAVPQSRLDVLVTLVDRFKRRLSGMGWSTFKPNDAFDRCLTTSNAFMWFCIGANVPGCRTIRLTEPARPLDESWKQIGFREHYLNVVYGNIFVDWTAKQFWRDVTYPMVMDTREFREYWRDTV